MSPLTIAVVFHNEEKNISLCLEPFVEETKGYEDQVEFLFIDNDSKDKTAQIIEAWKAKNSELRVNIISRSKNHMALARQEALDKSQSEYIAFVDADCFLQPGWMKAVINIIDDWDLDIGAFGGVSIYTDEKDWHKFAISLSHLFLWGKVAGQMQQVSHIPTNNYLVSKKAALSVDGFHKLYSRVGEDLDFNIRLNKKFKIYFNPNFQVEHKLPHSYFDWLKKMAFYGRAQSLVFLKNKGGLSGSKFYPLAFVLCSIYFLINFPLKAQITLIITLIVPRLRFFCLSFFYYGFGEIVGAFIYFWNFKKEL